MKKRIVSVFLLLCFVITLFPINVFAMGSDKEEIEQNLVETQVSLEIWDGSIADSYAGGNGSSGNPYLIATAGQLARVAQQTNSGVESGKYYKLTNDIYLNDTSSLGSWEVSPPQNKWIPIGTSSNQFASHFDGAGNTVFGLYISSEESCQGLFGYVPQDITISNVGVEKSYVKGLDNIGAVLGYCSGNISNCHSDSRVSGRNCVGGIVGGMGNRHSWAGDYEVNIRNCHNTGEIQGQQYVGGIAGKANFGYIFDSYNTADISGTHWVGGIGGYAIRATSCWNAGNIVGSNYVGGIFGEGGYFGDKSAEITTSFNAGSISGNNYVGGIYGISHVHSSLYECYITDCYNAGDITGKGDYIGGITGQAAIHNTGGGFFGANKCYYTNCYNIGKCIFGSGANKGAIFNVGCASCKNVYYLKNSCGLSYLNNFPNQVKEKPAIEMLRNDFLSILNGSGGTWKKDSEGINGGFPILASIDYRPFKTSDASIESPDFWCELAIMDSGNYEPLSGVSIFDDTTDTMLGYVEANGHFVLPGPGAIFVKNLPISFYKSGYKKFTCFYSDLDVGDTYAERPTNSIYMEKESEQSPSTEEKALIGEHIDFARTRYKEVTEKYGFYSAVWDRLAGDDGASKHLWAFYLWNVIGDVGELVSAEFDDLTIQMNWYDVFMSDLVLDISGNEKNTTFDDTAFKIYNKVHKEVQNDLVDAIAKLKYGESKDKSYQEIWQESNSAITKLLNGKDEPNDAEKAFVEKALKKICDSEVWYDVFEGLDAASTLISAGSDITEFIADITNAYIVAESAVMVNEEIYRALYLTAVDLEKMNPNYSQWFMKEIDKYYEFAVDKNSITKYLMDSTLLDSLNITYKNGLKQALKKCIQKTASNYLGIPLVNLEVCIAAYNTAFKVMNLIFKLDDCGEQYFIMNYIAPVEKSLENTVEEYGNKLIEAPSVVNSESFETAYGILRYTNKYLYDAAYNYGVYAKNKNNMEMATLLKHMWTLADCHNRVISNRSKYINIACPTDVYLYNASGELVVSIVDDVLETYTDPYVTVMNYDGEKSLMYSNDEDYRIRIIARENGAMDYSIVEVNGDDIARYSEFYDIGLTAGQEFSGDIPKGFGINEVEYTLSTNSVTVEADYDSDREFPCDQKGHSWGEWVVEIEPTNSNFGLKKRLCPICGKIESMSIEPMVSVYTITLESGGVTIMDSILLTDEDGKLTSLPSPTRPSYTFLGWFTSPTGGIQVTTDTIFTQDTTIYAQWQSNSNGGGSGNNPSIGNYNVNIEKTEHGKITAKPATVSPGDTVNLLVEPDTGFKLANLAVIDGLGKEVALTESEGQYVFKMPNGSVIVRAKFCADTGSDEKLFPFIDVAFDAWYADSVQYVYENGLMAGTSATTFAPNSTTTRGQLVTILYRMEGEPEIGSANKFSDVPAGQWYTNAVLWAADNNIVNGYGNSKFGPYDDITREQMATILHRYADSKKVDTSKTTSLEKYSDQKQIGSYAVASMQWAVAEGLITGTSQTTLSPTGTSTRAQIAAILQRYGEKFPTAK